MENLREILTLFQKIDFRPITQDLSPTDKKQVRYYSSNKIINALPQFILKMQYLHYSLMFGAVFVLIFAVVGTAVFFHLNTLTPITIVGLLIIVTFVIIMGMLDVNSTASDINDEKFKEVNQHLTDVSWFGDSRRIETDPSLKPSTIAAQKELAHEFLHPVILHNLSITDNYEMGEFYADYVSSLSDNNSFSAIYSRISLPIHLPAFRIERTTFRPFSPMRARRTVGKLNYFKFKYQVTANADATDEQVQKIQKFLNNETVAKHILNFYATNANLLDIYVSQDHLLFQWSKYTNSKAEHSGQFNRYQDITKSTLQIAQFFVRLNR